MTTRTMVTVGVEEELRRRLLSKGGAWTGMDKLPPVRELVNEFNVSASTLDKILRKLKKEGIIRSHQGKGYFRVDAIEQAKTHTIGVLIYSTNHIDHPIMFQRLSGIQKTLFEASYHVKLFALNPDSVAQASPPEKLPVDLRSVDALINHCELIGQDCLAELARHLPVVCTEWRVRGRGIGCVRQDYAGGAVQLARHLVERGYRSLALLTVHDAIVSASQQVEGFRLGLLGSGARLAVLTAEDWTREAGAELARRWLASPRREEALVCGSDEIATGVYDELCRAGLRVPEDVALTSWNDSGMTDAIPVPLTRVRMPFNRGGVLCAEEVLRLLGDPGAEGRELLLDAELVVGASTPSR